MYVDLFGYPSYNNPTPYSSFVSRAYVNQINCLRPLILSSHLIDILSRKYVNLVICLTPLIWSSYPVLSIPSLVRTCMLSIVLGPSSDHPISSSPGCTCIWIIARIHLIWSSYPILSRMYVTFVDCLNTPHLNNLFHPLQSVRDFCRLFEYPSSEQPISSSPECTWIWTIAPYLIIPSHPLYLSLDRSWTWWFA